MKIARLLVPALFLWGIPAQAQDQRTALVKADRTAAQLCADSGLTVALGRYLHPEGLLMWPGAPMLLGAKEALQFTRAQEISGRKRLTWQSLRVELSKDSALAAVWGVAMASGSRDTFPPRMGRILSVWRQDANRWTLAAVLLVGPAAPADTSAAEKFPRERPPATPTSETRAYVEADRSFAQLAKDSGAAVAFRTWAAAEAVTFGGTLLRGPQEISNAVAGPERWEWHPVRAGTSGPGSDLGWTAGEAVIGGAEGVQYSKYLTVWRHPPGQPVRYVIDAGNPRPSGSH